MSFAILSDPYLPICTVNPPYETVCEMYFKRWCLVIEYIIFVVFNFTKTLKPLHINSDGQFCPFLSLMGCRKQFPTSINQENRK